MTRIFTANNGSNSWLAVLRMGAALCLIAKVLSEWSYRDALYGSSGFIPDDIAAYSQHPHIPTVLGIYHHVSGLCSEGAFVAGFFILMMIVALSLLMGYMTRISAVICWLMMVTLFNSSHLTSYGYDAILLTLLFYCVIFPVGKVWSMDDRIRAKVLTEDESMTALFHKVIQIHVCLIYLVNGISKIHGAGWIDGSGLWDAIQQPQFQSLLTPGLIRLFLIPGVPAVISWSVLIAEIGFPFAIWLRGLRKVFFIMIILLHVGIAVVMGLWLFGFAMIVMDVVAFGHILRSRRETHGDALR